MKVFRLLLLTVCVLCISANSVQASIFGDLLSFDGVPDLIRDDSVGSFVEKGVVDSKLVVGDLVQGVIALDKVGPNDVPAGSSIFGIYSFEITAIGLGGSSLSLGAPTLVADNVLTAATAAGIDLSGISSATAPSTSFILVETAAEDIGHTDVTSGTIVPPEIGAEYSAVLAAGFDGIDDHHTITSILGDLTDLAALDLLDTLGITVATFTASYSVFDSIFSPGVSFLPILNPISGAFGDITIVNGTISSTDSGTDPNGWAFNDDGDYRINVTPEPVSVLVWGGLACAAGLVGYRRRRS